MLKNKFVKVFDYFYNNIFIATIICLQLAFAFVLIYSSLDMYINFNETKNKIVTNLGTDELYYIENNEDYTIRLYEKDNVSDYNKFYKYISDNYKILKCKNNNIFIEQSSLNEQLVQNSLTNMKVDDNIYSLFSAYWVNDNFMEYFDIKVNEGREFIQEDYLISNINSATPVVLGSGFKSMFKIGDEIEYRDYYYNNSMRKLKIIGFLNEDQYIVQKPIMIANVAYLKYSILLPDIPLDLNFINLDDKNSIDSVNMDTYKNITESFIISENNDLNKIKEKAEELNFFDINIVGSNYTTELSDNIYISEQNLNVLIIFLIIISTLITIFINIYFSIKKQKKDFRVYYSFGANKKYIIDLLIIELFMYFLGGVFLSINFIAMFKFFNFINEISLYTIMYTLIIFVFLMCVSALALYKYINKYINLEGN